MGFLRPYFKYYILADTSRTILWLMLLVTDDLDLLFRGSVLKGSYVFPMLSVYLLGIPFFRILLSKKIVQRKALPWHSITLYLQNCLGLEFFNSNIAGEMAQLMMKNQQHYVPLTDGESNQAEILEPIFFDGDALTEEHARNAQWMFKDGDSRIDRLEGLDPVHTDWHTKVKLYEVVLQDWNSFISWMIFVNDLFWNKMSVLKWTRQWSFHDEHCHVLNDLFSSLAWVQSFLQV